MLTDARESAVEKGRHEGANYSPAYAEHVGADGLDGHVGVIQELRHGTDPNVRGRVPQHRRIDSQIPIVELAVHLGAFQEPLHAVSHVGREVPVVGVKLDYWT
jgi:hypothetical protein